MKETAVQRNARLTREIVREIDRRGLTGQTIRPLLPTLDRDKLYLLRAASARGETPVGFSQPRLIAVAEALKLPVRDIVFPQQSEAA